MFILGMGGGVRNCMYERVTEYGDSGEAWDPPPDVSIDKGACGPMRLLPADIGLKNEDRFGECSIAVSRFIFE